MLLLLALQAIVQWFCIYKVKNEDKYRKKTQVGVCDGSTCGGQAQIHGPTYAPTPDMTDLCLAALKKFN